jgi:hypothetical protein
MMSSLQLKRASLRSGFLSCSLHHLEHLLFRYKFQIGIVKDSVQILFNHTSYTDPIISLLLAFTSSWFTITAAIDFHHSSIKPRTLKSSITRHHALVLAPPGHLLGINHVHPSPRTRYPSHHRVRVQVHRLRIYLSLAQSNRTPLQRNPNQPCQHWRANRECQLVGVLPLRQHEQPGSSPGSMLGL